MCPAEEQEAPAEPSGAGNGQLASGGASGLVEWAYVSDPGNGRDSNEDYAGAIVPEDTDAVPLFVVADGMGGHAAGEVASRLAVETVLGAWQSSGSGAAHQRLRSAVRAANVAVFDAGQDAERRGMGSTLTALALAGKEAVIAHAGDSRAYLVRGGLASQLTADHSRVGAMLRMRLITAEQAARHAARSMLTRSLGTDPVLQIDVTRQPTEWGRTYALCSHGSLDVAARGEIATIASGDPDREDAAFRPPSEAAAALVELALKRDAPDNVTVAVIRLVAHGPAPSRR